MSDLSENFRSVDVHEATHSSDAHKKLGRDVQHLRENLQEQVHDVGAQEQEAQADSTAEKVPRRR